MTVYITKQIAKGQKNTRWQFSDGNGGLWDGLLPTAGDYRVGQELDNSLFKSIRLLEGDSQSTESLSTDFTPAETHTYVNVLTGQVLAQDMTEAEFEAALEVELI